MRPYQLVVAIVGIFGAIFLLSGKDVALPTGLDLGLGGKLNSSRPERLLASVPMGQRLPSPGIALANGGVGYVPDVSSFFEPTVESETPSVAVPLADMSGCAFRSPRAGEVIGNVHVGRGGLPTPVSALSRSRLAEMALAEVRAARGGAALPAVEDPELMRAVDVFITERNAPVYLVLQSSEGDVLWNVQPSPGARIVHIAVVAAGQVGLLMPDAGVPVQVLRTGEQPGCAVAPVRRPDPGWSAFRNGGALIEGHAAAFEAYDVWFRDRFGIAAEANLVGFQETSHALVGPVPAPYDKVLQNRLAGARIAVTDADLVAIGPGEARTGRAEAAVRRLAIAAAGGDLAALGFTPLRRTE
ncbi:MAG: hypothetical protein OEM24_02285 [Paracoccaceae bacterium]|nr:hypothetical protein [Paracoccaceae bacterium]